MKNSLVSSKARNSSIELLRILAMLFIVLGHYWHGPAEISDVTVTVNKLFMEVTKTGDLGVDIFIIISGYFLINSNFKLNKLIKLIAQVFTYSFLIYLVFVFTGKEPFELKTFITVLFPTTTVQYWFFTAYVVLYLIHPFLNVVLKKLNKKQYLAMLILFVTIWSIIPTFLSGYNFFSSELFQLILMYSLGAYLRLYPLSSSKERKLGFALIFGGAILSLLFMILGKFLSFLDINHLGKYSLFVIMVAVGLFLVFKNFNFGQNKFINSVAMCTFGVYLIHDNNYIRGWLWHDVFSNAEVINSKIFVLYFAFAVLVVYIVCTIIEYFRIVIIERPLFKMLNNPIDKLEAGIKTLYNKIYQKINAILYD